MHNRIGFNRLGRKSSHRKALHKNMVTSLFKHERIETTQAKAKEIRRTAEKLITRAKVDSVHNRRIAAKSIQEKDVLNKLFIEIGTKFQTRAGGYTRILKLGKRAGDAADVVILELVEEEEKKSKPKKKSPVKKKAASKAKTEVKEEIKEEVKEEVVVESASKEEPKVEAKEDIKAPIEETETKEDADK